MAYKLYNQSGARMIIYFVSRQFVINQVLFLINRTNVRRRWDS